MQKYQPTFYQHTWCLFICCVRQHIGDFAALTPADASQIVHHQMCCCCEEVLCPFHVLATLLLRSTFVAGLERTGLSSDTLSTDANNQVPREAPARPLPCSLAFTVYTIFFFLLHRRKRHKRVLPQAFLTFRLRNEMPLGAHTGLAPLCTPGRSLFRDSFSSTLANFSLLLKCKCLLLQIFCAAQTEVACVHGVMINSVFTLQTSVKGFGSR